MDNVRSRQRPAIDRKESHSFLFEELVPNAGWTEDSNCHRLIVVLPGFSKELIKIQVDDDGNVLASGEKQVLSDVVNNKLIHFQQTYKVPTNSDLENVYGKYEGDTLYVIVPKKVKEKEEEEKPRPRPNETTINGVDQEKHDPAPQKQNEKENENENEKRTNGTSSINSVEEKLHNQGQLKQQYCDYESGFRGKRREIIREEDGSSSSVLGSVVDVIGKNKKGIVAAAAAAVLAFSLGLLFSPKVEIKCWKGGNN